MLAQRTWRRTGVASLALSALLAWYALSGGILRSTIYHLTVLFSSTTPDLAEIRSGWVCLAFWILFLLATLVSLYMAMLDFRFIRIQYHAAKRNLFHETLGDESFRKELKSPSEKRQ